MSVQRSITLTVFLIAAGVLAGCVDDGNDGAYQESVDTLPVDTLPVDTLPVEPLPAVEPTGVFVPVIAIDNTFRPDVVVISVGDGVFWENRGINEHDVLYVEGDDWGIEVEDFQPGDAYSHVFTEPGTYRYYCSVHGNTVVGMVGTVVVTG